jgi:ATP-dependent protease ClpP protease subunit
MNSIRNLPALPVPQSRKVTALADNSVLERFDREMAGVRAIERNDNVITIFDIIGEDFWSGEGVTAKSVAKQLRAISGPVEVQINSPGGDVFEGFAIYNLLREHPYDVSVKVIGMAASAASVIAMAGDTIAVGAAAFIMIHNCWVLAVGNRNDLREAADFLEPFDAALRQVYMARTGQKEPKINQMMNDETYINGQEAVDMGFADELLPSDATTVDKEAQARDRDFNAVRSMEQTLLASGLSRTQARERIQRIKASKPGAVDRSDDASTQDAAENQKWSEAALGFLASLKQQGT